MTLKLLTVTEIKFRRYLLMLKYATLLVEMTLSNLHTDHIAMFAVCAYNV